MRENKILTIILSVITVILGILYFLCFFIQQIQYWKYLDFIKNIFVGILCSSIVSIIICLINYFIAKNKLVNNFIRIENKIIDSIKIDTIEIPFDKILYRNFLNEAMDNYSSKRSYKEAVNQYGKNKVDKKYFNLKNHDKKDLLISHVMEILNIPFKENIERIISKCLENNKKDVNKIIKQYSIFKDIDVLELQIIANDFDCFFDKKIQKTIFEIIKSNINIKNEIGYKLWTLEDSNTIYFKIFTLTFMQEQLFESIQTTTINGIQIEYHQKYKNEIIKLLNKIILLNNKNACPIPYFDSKSLYRIS